MEELEHWRGHEKYTLFQAILLYLGVEPVGLSDGSCEENPKLKSKYIPVKKRFIEAIESSLLHADLKYLKSLASVGPAATKLGADAIDIEKSVVYTKDISAWLRGSDIPSKFFEESGQPAYLNPKHERYTPKLAATVNAWLAMNDPALLKRKNPGQALREWLGKHASECLRKKDDKNLFSDTAIGECARVANWKPKGGAPKTLG